jgi:GntR family transcriptional regulator, histidine utilization repressor
MEKVAKKRGPGSLHDRIAGTIRAKIMAGKLKPGDRIPVERELMARYRCSRMTVNKAISGLVAMALIERRKKAGSFVARPRIHFAALTIPDIRQEIESRGAIYTFKLLSRESRRPKSMDPELMSVPPTASILFMTCLHLADESVFALEERYINLRAVPEASGTDFSTVPPGTWLLTHVPWTEAEHRISATSAGGLSRQLGVKKDVPCLILECKTWRGADTVTYVRHTFPRSDFDLIARFGSPGDTHGVDGAPRQTRR